MNFFNFDIKKVLLIIFLILMPLFLLTLTDKEMDNNFIFRSFVYVNSTIQNLYHSTLSSTNDTVDTYLNLIQIKKQSRKLLAENNRLKARQVLMREIKLENKRLKKVLKFEDKTLVKFVIAQVIGRDPVSDYQLITINRGADHGIKKNMLVINEVGVVGYIFRLSNQYSQVILLTDPHASIYAIIQRSRIYGIVEGSNKNECKLRYLKIRDDVKKGDIIVTSGLNLLSKGGFPIGVVTSIKKKQYNLTQEVTLRPFVNSTQLEEVFVVSKIEKQETK